MAESIQLIGGKECEKALRELDLKLARKYAGKALRKGAKLVLNEVKREVPVASGKLKSLIKIRVGRNRRGYRSVVVGASGKGGFTGTDVFYGSFLEFGHRQGKRSLGNKRKEIPGEHFMENSFDDTADAAAQAIISTLKGLIGGDK